MKNTRKPTKKLDLDVEVIADLEATDAQTEAIRGGASSSRTDFGGTSGGRSSGGASAGHSNAGSTAT